MAELESLIGNFAELYLRLVRVLDRRMAEEGASLARTRMLLALQKQGTMRATDLADFFNQSPRTVTEAIDGLERDGLLERTPDPSDRRAKLVSITLKGLAAVKKTEPLRRKMLEQTFGVLDRQERETLQALLERIGGALTEAARDTADPIERVDRSE